MRNILVVLLGWAGMAHAVIRFVPDDFGNLQEALDESNANDTIVCRPGVYQGPFFIWAQDITIASEFIQSHDPAHIATCVVRPSLGSPDNRCFDTQPADSSDTELRMVGLTISLGRAITVGDDKGGGINLRNRTADIQDCVFKSCQAGFGGAIYADSSVVTLTRCLMPSNDAFGRGEVICARNSIIHIVDSDIGPDSHLIQSDIRRGQIELNRSSITLSGTRIHDYGNTPEGWAIFFRTFDDPVEFVDLQGCIIENNIFNKFVDDNGPFGPRDFILDSCVFADNGLPFGLWSASFNGRSGTTLVTRCLFETNIVPPNTAGGAILTFVGSRVHFVCEQNYFRNNYGGTAACIGLWHQNDPVNGHVHRNYFSENSSFGYFSGQSRAIDIGNVGEGVLEYNAFEGNIGLAVLTDSFFTPTSYALHNFWGDSTGPYEATRNPGGLGDTTNAATIYDEWLLSADEIPDTSLFPNPVGDSPLPISSTWQLGTIYPNPFNSEFRVVLDGMTGADFEVKLFDLLGREIALLHRGRTLRGTLNFAAPTTLAAGIYFISAHDRFYSETKKVLYLK